MSVELHPQYVIDETGARRSVVLSVEEFEALLAQLEDEQQDYAADVAALDRAAEGDAQSKPWRQVRDEIEARHKP